eukprot:464333-Rhodomonas_salina.1
MSSTEIAPGLRARYGMSGTEPTHGSLCDRIKHRTAPNCIACYIGQNQPSHSNARSVSTSTLNPKP